MIKCKYVHAFLALSLTLSFALSGCSEVEQSSTDEMNPAQHAPMQEGVEFDFWEQIVSVHESLPEFILQLRGEGDDFTELSIVNSSTGAVVYQDYFNIEDMWGIRKDVFAVELIDMDFDGYQDIQIFTGYGGNWKNDYIYIMWSADEASFVGDIYGLSSLGLPTFDVEQRLVHSIQRASAADHWFYAHQYINGELVTIEEISDNCVWDHWLDDSAKEQIKILEPLYETDSTFMHFTKKQLDENTMELVIVEEKYVLFTDQVEAAEYSSDSEMGLLLAGYEKYRD